MKKILYLFITIPSLEYARAQEPADLVQVRATYQNKLADTHKTYIEWLRKRSDETKGEVSIQYLKEIERVGGKTVLAPEKEMVVDNTPDHEKLDGRSITIDSKKGYYSLGKLSKGDKVRLQYTAGIWRAYPDWRTESPDNPALSQHGISLVMRDKEVMIIKKDVRNTVEKIFEYTIEQDGDYNIEMNATVRANCTGSVRYQLEVSKSK